MDFFPEIDLDLTAAEAIARGLYGVALVDGVHERELALIDGFYREIEGDSGTGAIAALDRLGALEPAALAALLPQPAQRELFVKTAFLLGWADGKLSPGEKNAIAGYAQALGIDGATQARLEAEVKDYLLRPLANLANVEAAAEVAKKLGV